MTTYVALLRAVNVGGTGKLPMSDLVAMCEAACFEHPRTCIASGNVVFASRASDALVQAALQAELARYAGKPVGVLLRSATQMAQVLRDNPFADALPERTAAIFLDRAPAPDALDGIKGRADEQIALGVREIYVRYGVAGIGQSKLKIALAAQGTARNMNTAAKLAAMAAALNA